MEEKKKGIKPALQAIACTTGAVTLFVGFSFVVLFVGVMLFLMYHTSGTPLKTPKEKHGEFPFELVYTLNGEQVEIRDTLIVDYSKTTRGADGKSCYQWDSRLESGKDWPKRHTNSIVIFDKEETILFRLGPSDYYMGFEEAYTNVGTFLLAETGVDLSRETLYENYGIQIIRARLSSPLGIKTDPESHGFEYTELVASVEITNCIDQTSTTITVPAMINGKEVTALGEDAFSRTTQVQTIILPDTLQVIDDGAFSHCESLQSIHIPKGVRYIGVQPFFGCSSLQSITVAEENEYFVSKDGVLYNKDMTTLIAYPEGKAAASFTQQHDARHTVE